MTNTKGAIMGIIIEKEAGGELGFDHEEVIKKVIMSTLQDFKCPYEPEVSVLLTDDREIQRLNREFRGIDRTTDVLSFPAADYEVAGDFSAFEERMDVFDPETGALLLGDIAISVERARKQAEEYGHSLLREIAFLTAHSVLHLLGFDHMEEGERKVMEDRQRGILEQIGIVRDGN